MEEAISLGQKLASIGFPTLLVVILVGSYFDIWAWGRQLRDVKAEKAEMKAECAARLAEVIEEKNEWKRAAFNGAGLAETSVDLAKRR